MSESFEEIINKLSIQFSQIETNTMDEIKNQIEALQASVQALTLRLTTIEKPAMVEEYKDEIPVSTQATLTSIKALPEFHGKAEEYSSWRNLITTAMKFVGKNNADQRAMYVVEQELIVLQQGRMNVHEFYDKINEKLNTIITKIHMTYKEKVAADTLIENMREKALRTFITGLNNNTGSVLYSSNPKTLAEAYARLQTILSDRERMNFASQYNRNDVKANNNQGNRNEINHDKNRSEKSQNNFEQRKRSDFRSNPNFTMKIEQQPNVNKTSTVNNNQTPMDIDTSSMNVNIDNDKRKNDWSGGSNQYSRQHKLQRVNNIENVNDEEEDVNDSDETLSQASIFLDL